MGFISIIIQSGSNSLRLYTKMARKSLLFVALALCSVSSLFAAEADWEILNFAIANPGGSNPQVLKNSILNILGGFIPPIPDISFAAPAPTPAPVPVVTAAPTPAPTAAPTLAPTLAPTQRPPAPVPGSPYPQIQLILPNGQPIYLPYPLPQPSPAVPVPQPTVAPAPVPASTAAPPAPCPCNQPAPCSCVKSAPCDQKKNLAEFVVNVPCPTTTPKPIRQIIVKVPCPTTTKKPCECQCCPCNPCKSPKKKVYKESSESDSHEETKTVYKSYDPVIKKRVEVKRNDVPKAYPFSYHGTGGYHRVNVQRNDD